MYRDDGAGGGTWRVTFTSGGTGPCWNISVDDPLERDRCILHICDLDAFIAALQHFAASDVRREADLRWKVE
jgi:hypothetical protein